jgi:peptidyl-prolyl cis-trans isomerase B (cyclophilin B)
MPVRLLVSLLALTLALALAACGGDEGEETEAPAQTPSAAEEAGCESVEAPRPKPEADLSRPDETLDASTTYVAEVVTSCGTFEITLDADRAPRTGGSFKALADEDFFDGTTFHRISPGFVIQGGDPQGNGTGGPGYSVREEPPQDLTYSRGVVAMAKTAAERPGTSGSQFFVVTAEDAGLPPDYALLGEVTEGMEVVDRIATLPIDPASEQPEEPVVIRSITVAER